MVDVQVTYPLLVFVIKYVYIKTPTPVMSAHKLLDNQPTTSFAWFSNQATTDPMILGRAAPAFAANFPSRELSAFNLFFIHSLAPPFLSFVVVLFDVGVDVVLGPPNRASIRTPRVIPKAVKIDTIVTPCSLNSVLILSPSVPISLSKNFVIDPLI